MLWVFPTTDVVADPFVVKADAAVCGTGPVAAHFCVRSCAAVVRDALQMPGMKHEHGIRRIQIVAAVGKDGLNVRRIKDAVVVEVVLTNWFDVDDPAVVGNRHAFLDDPNIHRAIVVRCSGLPVWGAISVRPYFVGKFGLIFF